MTKATRSPSSFKERWGPRLRLVRMRGFGRQGARRIAAVAVGALMLLSCGTEATTSTGGGGSSAPAGSVPSSGGASPSVADCPATRDQKSMSFPETPPSSERIPLAEDPTQTQNPDPVMFEVIHAYAAAHGGDEYVDSWIDRSKRGSPIVVAFTDHVDEHRAALLATRPASDDPPATMRTAGGPSVPDTRVTNGTTLGESRWPVEVVLMNDAGSRFRGLRNRVILYGQTDGRSLNLSPSNNTNDAGLLEISVGTPISDAVRQDLATRFGADKVCVRVVKMATAVQ